LFVRCYNLIVTKGYETLEHTADIGIVAHGKDISEVFVNAAKGFLSLIVDPKQVEAEEKFDIEVSAPDREALLVNWMNELIYLVSAKEVLLKEFNVIELTDTSLKIKASGEKIKKSKHHFKREVKAATYHKLKIERTDGEWQSQVIFDI
jgi:SHS2 domain-containing protein